MESVHAPISEKEKEFIEKNKLDELSRRFNFLKSEIPNLEKIYSDITIKIESKRQEFEKVIQESKDTASQILQVADAARMKAERVLRDANMKDGEANARIAKAIELEEKLSDERKSIDSDRLSNANRAADLDKIVIGINHKRAELESRIHESKTLFENQKNEISILLKGLESKQEDINHQLAKLEKAARDSSIKDSEIRERLNSLSASQAESEEKKKEADQILADALKRSKEASDRLIQAAEVEKKNQERSIFLDQKERQLREQKAELMNHETQLRAITKKQNLPYDWESVTL